MENCKLLPFIYRVILVSIVTTLETALPRNRGLIPGRGEIFHTKFRPELGPIQPLVRWVLGDLTSRAKRQNCERDYLPPSSAEVKNSWSQTFTPPYFFCMHSGNFASSLYSRVFSPTCIAPYIAAGWTDRFRSNACYNGIFLSISGFHRCLLKLTSPDSVQSRPAHPHLPN